MGRIALGVILLAGSAAADPIFQRPPAAKGYSYPECYCTNRGERVEMGELACIRIGSNAFTARCGMSQNSPTWRKVEDGCPPAGDISLAPPGLLEGSEARQPG